MGGSFIKTNFRENAFFNDGTYLSEMYFRGSYFEKIIDFSNSSFDKLDLTNTYMNITNFNNIKNSNSNKTFIEIFANRETARIIKSHYEKQNNILEANKYFVIEQEKYIDELKKIKTIIPKAINGLSLPIRLNKLVSNFGTDWVRAILALLVWAIASNLLFGLFNSSYISIFEIMKDKPIYAIGIEYINTLTKMINPINAFKDDDIFKGYEAFGAIVRIISTTIIYQFLVAFRQNTRRINLDSRVKHENDERDGYTSLTMTNKSYWKLD